jgi:surfeit locus 1 family protein
VPVRRRGLLIPSLFTLAALAVLLGLGTWQIERKAWKENLIETLTKRLESDPAELPKPADWARLDANNAEFQRVRVNVQFRKAQDGLQDKVQDNAQGKAQDALVYTSGSQLRDDVKGAGFFVFSPALLAGGPSIVVINRGFVPDKNYPQVQGTQEVTQEIIGVLRWPEAPSLFVPDRDSAGLTWFVRDHRAMAQALGWGDVAPFYIEQEDPVPPGGLPHPSVLKVRLRNDHLQYAITWFGLALVLVIMFAVWVWRQRREANDTAWECND